MSFSESPEALGSLIDDLEAEAGIGTSDTPPNPDNAAGQGQEPPPEGAEPSQTPDGITEQKPQEGAATPPPEQKQSPFPKELEPYKPLFEKKKWDPSKPDWQGEALKTLQEQEQFQGRMSTDLGLTRTQAAELSNLLHGTPSDINAYRQRMGLPELPFEQTSLEDKLKAADSEWDLWQKALSQDPAISGEAIRAITQKLQERREDLRLEQKAAKNAPKPAQSSLANDAKLNWARIQERDPEANKAMSALVPFLKSPAGNGLLGSFGMDVHNIMATPERANQAYDLAKRLHLGDPQVFEAEVSKRVKAEMEGHRKRQVQGAIPGGVPAAASNHNPDEVEAHLEGMFRG